MASTQLLVAGLGIIGAAILTRKKPEQLSAPTGGKRFYPLWNLPDGRKPTITSAHKDDNSSRPTHNGVDFFYQWFDEDPEVFTGRGGNGIIVKGKRRWWYPDGEMAYAASDGVVSHASKISTGFRVWVDHRDGTRSGYFHGEQLLVGIGDVVHGGVTPIIIVGVKEGGYKKHLHFEISPVGRYAPTNPKKWLESAQYVSARHV